MLEMAGVVQEVLPNTQFRVELTNGASRAGPLPAARSAPPHPHLAGDRVQLESSGPRPQARPHQLPAQDERPAPGPQRSQQYRSASTSAGAQRPYLQFSRSSASLTTW